MIKGRFGGQASLLWTKHSGIRTYGRSTEPWTFCLKVKHIICNMMILQPHNKFTPLLLKLGKY